MRHIEGISEAELYAVLYGLLYIQRSNSLNRHVLMNDCEAAVRNNKLIELGKLLNTKLIWIPREINKADKIAKGKVNKKKKTWSNLDFLMKIILERDIYVRLKKEKLTESTIQPLSII